ncbi:hypothetical protein EYC80_006413 [Monilinia laxa]|uniref:Uncharacterized protein n=1 Tax=Monilinia laxa TaxID=61186 RepID=A0A5N6JRW0_MONLA|nr:hypothetical protein EYC80_006413 [Monilinia laxa]
MPPKRKAISELSDNPHTTKSRNRLNHRNEDEVQIEMAKASDQAAITYRLGTVRQSSEWIEADEDERAQIKERVKRDVAHKRIVKGVHASIVAQRLGYGEEGGQFAQFDDNNPNFEDCEEEDEFLQERIWREDDERNGGKVVSIEGSREEQEIRVFNSGIKRRQCIEFRTWQNKWNEVLQSFKKKCYILNLRGMEYLISYGPYINRRNGKSYDIIPPHKFFTVQERMIWRNLRIAIDGGAVENDSDWVQLPGPAEWYSKDYDFEKHGFHDPQEKSARLYKEILALLLFTGDYVPEEYRRVNFTCGDFRMMSKGELLFQF